MNRTLGILLSSLALMLAACATAPANSPVTPADLGKADGQWPLFRQGSCTKQDGVVVELSSYMEKKGDPDRAHVLSRITMNKVLVHQGEGLRDDSTGALTITAHVKNPDGSWTEYDYIREREAVEAATTRIVGMDSHDFAACARTGKQ